MNDEIVLQVLFFQTLSGREVAREWLKSLSADDRKTIGGDLQLVQFRWPLGMPLVRKIEPDLWEVRTHLSNKRIARTFFTVRDDQMAILHGFIKKSQKTPQNELKVARNRRDLWLRWFEDDDEE